VEPSITDRAGCEELDGVGDTARGLADSIVELGGVQSLKGRIDHDAADEHARRDVAMKRLSKADVRIQGISSNVHRGLPRFAQEAGGGGLASSVNMPYSVGIDTPEYAERHSCQEKPEASGMEPGRGVGMEYIARAFKAHRASVTIGKTCDVVFQTNNLGPRPFSRN